MIGIERRLASPSGGWLRQRLRALRAWLIGRWGLIGLHGIMTFALYLLFVLLARVISFGRVERSVALYIAITAAGAIFLLMIAAFVRTLWQALCATADLDIPDGLRPILLTAGGAGLALLTFPRLLSKDVLSYLAYGRAFGAYHLNPYNTTPNNIQFDYNFRLIDWHDAISVYGPAWTLLCTALYKAVALVATSHVWGYIVAFRALGLAFHLVNIALLWIILGRIRPHWRVAGTIFYAWNPLALLEFVGNGHNDVVLITFLLAALVAQTAPRPRPWLVALFLALSVLIKFITLLILPAYLLLLWRATPDSPGRWRHRARLVAWVRAGVAVLITFVVLWAPFWSVLRDPLFLFNSTAAFTRYDNSLLQVFYWGGQGLLSLILPPEQSRQIADQIVKVAGRVAFLALWGYWTWRTRDFASWLRASFWIFFAYLVVGTPWFWPWYVTWLIPLAPIVGSRLVTAATLTFSASVLFIYLTWGNQLPFDRGSLYPLHNIVLFGVPLLTLWLQLRRGGAADQPVYHPTRQRGAAASLRRRIVS